MMAVGAWLAKSALMSSPAGGLIRGAGGFLKRVPWKVWVAIAIAVALWLGWRWHQHAVHTAYKQGYAAAIKDIRAAEAKKIAPLKEAKAAGDAQIAASTQQIRKTHDAQVTHVDRNLADLLGVLEHTQGAARSQAGGRLPGAAGAAGAERGASPADDRLAQDVAADPGVLVAIPARQLYTRSATCDRDYSALTAWEDWYAAYKRTYDEWQAKTRKLSR